MAESGALARGQDVDDAAKCVSPSPRVPKRLRLSTAVDVRREMVAVYRDARHGRLPEQRAARLVFMLDKVRAVIETSELEDRIADLERRVPK